MLEKHEIVMRTIWCHKSQAMLQVRCWSETDLLCSRRLDHLLLGRSLLEVLTQLVAGLDLHKADRA